jgi:pseudouridine kinase
MSINSKDHNIAYAAVIGGANMDICGSPTNLLISGDSNPGVIKTNPGGVARNIAENLARLGVECHMFSVLGQDKYGEMILEQGNEIGINMDAVLRTDNNPTPTYLSVLDGNGDLEVGINDMAAMDELTPEYLLENRELIYEASVVVADTNMSVEALACLATMTTKDKLIIDAVSMAKAIRVKPYLNSIGTLKVNKAEAQAISGIVSGETEKISNWFHDNGVHKLYITLGSEGAYYSSEEEQGAVAPPEFSKLINANGAGDAFVAAVVYSMLENCSMRETTKFAICAAGLTIAHNATINPSMSIERINNSVDMEYGS